jgi:hypothetical protein
MTLFNTEGPSFPPSAVSAPPMRPCPCVEQVIPTSSVPDTLWVPLDEAVYAWTTFGTMTMHNAALIATGSALHAISWEQTALRHYTHAQQGLRSLRMTSARPTVLSLLTFTTDALAHATEQWRRVILWLERLANAHDDPPDASVLDTIRDLYRQATDFQHRLWLLAGEVQQEQRGRHIPRWSTIRHVPPHAQKEERANASVPPQSILQRTTRCFARFPVWAGTDSTSIGSTSVTTIRGWRRSVPAQRRAFLRLASRRRALPHTGSRAATSCCITCISANTPNDAATPYSRAGGADDAGQRSTH